MDLEIARILARPHVQSAFDSGKWPEYYHHFLIDDYYLEIYDSHRYFKVDLCNHNTTIRQSVFDGKTQLMYTWLSEVPVGADTEKYNWSPGPDGKRVVVIQAGKSNHLQLSSIVKSFESEEYQVVFVDEMSHIIGVGYRELVNEMKFVIPEPIEMEYRLPLPTKPPPFRRRDHKRKG